MKEIKITGNSIILVAVALIIGFLIGRAFVNEKPVETKKIIKYVKSRNVIKDTIIHPEPYEVVKWRYRKSKHDTIFLPSKVLSKGGKEVAAVDTSNSIKDYFLTRKYNLDFSNDTIGIFRVNAEVNQNRLILANSYINPTIKTVTETKMIYKVPLLQFYTMIGSSVDLQTNQLQFGIDLRQKFLIGVSGIRMYDKYGYTINAGIKF